MKGEAVKLTTDDLPRATGTMSGPYDDCVPSTRKVGFASIARGGRSYLRVGRKVSGPARHWLMPHWHSGRLSAARSGTIDTELHGRNTMMI